jgi:cyanate permease
VTLLSTGSGGAPVAAIALGAAMGGEIDLIGFLVARHFPLAAFGRIYGFQYAGFILGAGLSPLWMGAIRDSQDSYFLALSGCSALIAVAALLFLFLPHGQRERRT